MGLVDFIPVVILLLLRSNGANLTDGIDWLQDFGSISVGAGNFRSFLEI
jgi:hypothetical protein